MKWLAQVTMFLCLVLAALLLLSGCLPCPDCGSQFYEGRNSLRGELKTCWDNGYNAGYAMALEDLSAQCCDLCLVYPTRERVEAFLSSDNTSSIAYDYKSFICTDFTEVVNHNAWEQGIPCSTVWITFEKLAEGHSIVAFPVRTSGGVDLLYVEPMNDHIFDEGEIAVGQYFSYQESECSCKPAKIGKIRYYR